MLRVLAAVVLAGHGLIHIIGFVVPWRLAVLEGFAYRTTGLNGAISLGETGARLVGIGWLAVTVGFLVAAAGVRRGASWAVPFTAAMAAGSLVVCVLGLPETVAGVLVDVIILAGAAYLAFVRGGAASPIR